MKYWLNRKLIFLFLILSVFTVMDFSLSAQPFPPPFPPDLPPMAPCPKRDFFPPEDDNSEFLLKGIRISPNHDNHIIMSFLFNKVIDPVSISELTILINGEPIKTDDIIFSKDGRKVRIFLNNIEGSFSINISGLKACNNETMQPVFIDSITEASDMYLSKDNIWKKHKPKYNL